MEDGPILHFVASIGAVGPPLICPNTMSYQTDEQGTIATSSYTPSWRRMSLAND